MHPPSCRDVCLTQTRTLLVTVHLIERVEKTRDGNQHVYQLAEVQRIQVAYGCLTGMTVIKTMAWPADPGAQPEPHFLAARI